jgi:hypothetical protein
MPISAAAIGGAIIRPINPTKPGSTQTGVTIGSRPSTATRKSNSSSPSRRNSAAVTISRTIEAARSHGVRAGGMAASSRPATSRLSAHSGEASGAAYSRMAVTAIHNGSATAHTVAGSRA